MSEAKSTYPARPITKGRIQTLFVTANNVIKATGHWADTNEFKTHWLYPEFGVKSTKELTVKQADHAIATLQRMLGDGVERLSHGQKEKIKALAFHLMDMQQESLWNVIHRQTGYNKALNMLTPGEASKVIVGLQKIYCMGNDQAYQKLNTASARYIRSETGKKELEELRHAS